MAAVKLGDHDYVRLERAPEEAARHNAITRRQVVRVHRGPLMALALLPLNRL